MIEEDEERTRMVDELHDIQSRLKTVVTLGGAIEMVKRAIEVTETIWAIDSDARSAAEAESHYDSSTTTSPVISGDEYNSAKVIADAEARRLSAIDNRPEAVYAVKEGSLLHPGDWHFDRDISCGRRFQWGDVADSPGWEREVILDIDPKGVRDDALNLAKRLKDPVQKERLLYELLRHQQAFARNMQLVIDEIAGNK